MEFTYDVFFSYRHRPLDGEITRRTFNAIESYRLPDAMRRRGFQDIRRAFRDTEELPVSRILTDTIDKALHATNCLVVVCSTDTPSSEWIDREVATFIEIGRADHIYPLLISGDPETSFPPSLKLVPDILDRVMDIRAEGNDIRKMMAKEETELLRVISGVVGCKESELLREHKMRKNRRTVLRAAAAAAAFALVTAVSLGLMNLAQSYRDAAQRQEKASMRILNELTYDLPDRLTNVPGAYGRIAQILRQNTADIDAILRLSTDREGAAYEAAANYEKLANAGGVLGRYDEALQAQDEAIGRCWIRGAHGPENSLPLRTATAPRCSTRRGGIGRRMRRTRGPSPCCAPRRTRTRCCWRRRSSTSAPMPPTRGMRKRPPRPLRRVWPCWNSFRKAGSSSRLWPRHTITTAFCATGRARMSRPRRSSARPAAALKNC